MSGNAVQAAEAGPGSRDRLLAVTGYAVSLYATIMRTDKPFKDLFGATYEYIDPVKGLRGFAEKVRTQVLCKQLCNTCAQRQECKGMETENSVMLHV